MSQVSIFLSLLFVTNLLWAGRAHLDPLFNEPTVEEFKQALVERTLQLDLWVEDLQKKNINLICLGETHSEEFRKFYAKAFFSKYKFEALYLEAQQSQVDEFVALHKSGKTDITLLGAPIAPIIASALKTNPNLKFYGIEMTPEQKIKAQKIDETNLKGQVTREGYIAQNLFDNFHAGQKSVMLYGASHCAANDIGLGHAIPAFEHIRKALPMQNLLSVVVRSRQPLRFFSANLSKLNLQEVDLVFTQLNTFSPMLYKSVWKLRKEFQNYDNLIYLMNLRSWKND